MGDNKKQSKPNQKRGSRQDHQPLTFNPLRDQLRELYSAESLVDGVAIDTSPGKSVLKLDGLELTEMRTGKGYTYPMPPVGTVLLLGRGRGRSVRHGWMTPEQEEKLARPFVGGRDERGQRVPVTKHLYATWLDAEDGLYAITPGLLMSCGKVILGDDTEDFECGDEGRLCPECLADAADYWADYFGLRPGMTREQRREQLERFRPPSRVSEENNVV